MVPAKRCNATVPKFYFWEKLSATATGEHDRTLGLCLQQGTRVEAKIEVRETKMKDTTNLIAFGQGTVSRRG